METSQRYKPSVKGEVNWGKSSTNISAAIKNLETLDKLEGEDYDSEDEEEEVDNHQNNSADFNRRKILEKKKANTTSRLHNNVRKSIRNYIIASGGIERVSSGVSRSFGHAGLAVLRIAFKTISEINLFGLEAWLRKRNISIEKITRNDLLDILYDVCAENVIGLDETAANQALVEMLDNLSKLLDSEGGNWEEKLRQGLDKAHAKEIIDNFIGTYIYAHLLQNFIEKLEKKYDQDKISRYMSEIKDLIISDVHEGISGHDSTQVDWRGSEGQTFIINEFKNILNILLGNDN
jgi:hypothetical protein